MTPISPDDVTGDDLETLHDLIWTMPDGELREALAYIHDVLTAGNTVVVGALVGAS